MDLKEVEKRDIAGPLQKYSALPAEVARARVGLKLSGREKALPRLPVTGTPEGSNSYIDREAAEYVVAGNLALFQHIELVPVLEDLQEARETVISGLNALQLRATQAAAITRQEYETGVSR